MTYQFFLDATPPLNLAPPPSDAVALRYSPTLGRVSAVGPDDREIDIGSGTPHPGTPVNGVKAVGTLTGDGTIVTSGDVVTIDTRNYTFRKFKASNTLTGTATNVSNGDTVTIGSTVYTFQTTLTNVNGNVFIGASAAASLTNLFYAINASGGVAGTNYALATTANTQVVATNPSGTTLVATAILAGTAQNAIATTETAAQLSWAATTLGGVGATSISTGGLADGDVNISTTAALTLTNLFRAINGTGGTPGADYNVSSPHALYVATNPSGTTVVITARGAGTAYTAATSEASTHLSWGAALTAGAVNGTPARAGDQLYDASFLYTAHADMTIESTSGWYKSTNTTL